jgi:hypothetical protein
MARTVKPVLAASPGQSSTLDIPQDVKDEIDGLWAYMVENPGHEGFVTFDEGDDLEKEKGLYLRQVRQYAQTREGGALKFRQLPSKHLKPTEVRFSLARDIPKDGENHSKSGPVGEAPKPTKPSK